MIELLGYFSLLLAFLSLLTLCEGGSGEERMERKGKGERGREEERKRGREELLSHPDVFVNRFEKRINEINEDWVIVFFSFYFVLVLSS